MNLSSVLYNRVLIIALVAWALAQVLKVPIYYLRTRRWNWALLLTTGGMPSSHSALITATTHAIGLYIGFDSPLFALAVAITMIVTYDAAGVRRQAGMHAKRINMLFDELMSGQPLDEKALREVLGHTPLEVIGGIIWGISVATFLWMIWH